MNPFFAAVARIGIAALGGALAVFGGYDDSPGGTLLGLVLVFSALAFGAKTALRISQHPAVQSTKSGPQQIR